MHKRRCGAGVGQIRTGNGKRRIFSLPFVILHLPILFVEDAVLAGPLYSAHSVLLRLGPGKSVVVIIIPVSGCILALQSAFVDESKASESILHGWG